MKKKLMNFGRGFIDVTDDSISYCRSLCLKGGDKAVLKKPRRRQISHYCEYGT